MNILIVYVKNKLIIETIHFFKMPSIELIEAMNYAHADSFHIVIV